MTLAPSLDSQYNEGEPRDDLRVEVEEDVEHPGWYAEVELRRWINKTYPDDWDLPSHPSLDHAEHFDPEEYYAELNQRRRHTFRYWADEKDYEEAQKRDSGIRVTGKKVKRHPRRTIHERMEDLPGVEVYDDKIVIPLGVDHRQYIDPRNYTDWPRGRPGPGVHGCPGHDFGPDDWPERKDDDSPWPKLVDLIMYWMDISYDDIGEKDPRPIYVQVLPEHDLCTLQTLYKDRRRQSRDLKGLVTARDSSTGTGKTTLACQLSSYWDVNGWTADKATLDPERYNEMYTELPEGSVLLLDEAEQAADNRRSMSASNLTLTHMWSMMRFKQVFTLCTLPTLSMVDKRLKELSDIRIHCTKRGVAKVYRVKIDDTNHDLREVRMHRVRWDAMDDNPEYQKLTEKKDKRVNDYAEEAYFSDDGDEVDPAVAAKEAEMSKRNELIEDMSENGMTHQEIADVVGLSRSTISKIISGA